MFSVGFHLFFLGRESIHLEKCAVVRRAFYQPSPINYNKKQHVPLGRAGMVHILLVDGVT